MGWLEFQEWLGAMDRQRNGQTSDPESWAGSESDAWWEEAREKRRERQGR